MDVKDIIKWLLSQKSPEKPSKAIVMLILAVNVIVCQAHSSTNTTDHSVTNFNVNNLSKSVINRTDYFAKVFKNDHELVKQRIKSWMFTTTKYVRDYLKNMDTNGMARTFGRPIRQLQSALLPVMFKLGVISTLVVLTFIMVAKAVGIGLLLLMFKIAGALAKVKSLFSEPHHHHGHHGWSPHKEVHVHVHGSSGIGGEGISSLMGGHDSWHRLDPSVSSSSLSSNFGSSLSSNFGSNLDPGSIYAGSYAKLANKLSSYSNNGPSSINTPYGQYIRVGDPTAPASF